MSMARKDKLPNIGRTRKATSIDDINEIKLRTQQLELECKQIKAKTQRLRQIIKERNDSIKSVVSSTGDKQAPRFSGKTTVESLQKTAKSLENTLKARNEELESLMKSDKVAMCEELQIEIQTYFLERKRLQKQIKEMKEGESIIESELNRLKKQSMSASEHESAIDSLQGEIDQLTEKLFAYHKSEMRIKCAKMLKSLYENPSLFESIKNQVLDEIQREKDQLAENKRIIEEVQKKEERNVQYLQTVLERQAQKVREAIGENSKKE